MKIIGMLRVKNEARWVHSVVASILHVCDRVHIMDDHSGDDTAAICRAFGNRVMVYDSPFAGLDEARDKNWLLNQIRQDDQSKDAHWVLAIDGDELLMDPVAIGFAAHYPRADCYALRVLYLWDSRTQVRIDGVYGRFWRPSLFRLRSGDSFRATRNGGNFHCGNVPQQFTHSVHCDARLLHFGYMESGDRRRKFDWYNRIDPNNLPEDRYVHMIQGDPGGPPMHARLRHAGPLELSALRCTAIARISRPTNVRPPDR